MKYSTDLTLLHIQLNLVVVTLTIPAEPTEHFRVFSIKFYSIISVWKKTNKNKQRKRKSLVMTVGENLLHSVVYSPCNIKISVCIALSCI